MCVVHECVCVLSCAVCLIVIVSECVRVSVGLAWVGSGLYVCFVS
jgi:hypothetical protein